ncbi:MAG: hypothetical protein QNK14_01730, partial [Desulfobacterales bacterium]|nr:hypothetical protein [Desulfobacterales bacterium]
MESSQVFTDKEKSPCLLICLSIKKVANHSQSIKIWRNQHGNEAMSQLPDFGFQGKVCLPSVR